MMTKEYLVALDAGGTMTDTFLVDDKGEFIIGKFLTNTGDEASSYYGSVGDAASYWNLTSNEVHKNAESVIYAGTSMLNIVVSRIGQRVGMLMTKGFEDMAIMERSLTYLHLDFQERMKPGLHEHPPALIDRKDVRGVCERITGGTAFAGCHLEPGTVVIPLNEDEVREAVDDLLDRGVAVIGILFQCSYANPVHERRAAEIARERVKLKNKNVNVVTSYEVCPRQGENNRFKSLLIHCFAADEVKERLLRVEARAKGGAYRYPLQTLLAYGATANVQYQRLYEAMMSGPIGGMIGCQYLMSKTLGVDNVCAADLGGTSFDVGLVVKGYLSTERQADFSGHRVGMPVVSLDSISGGTGLEIVVDEFQRIALGPKSAGSRVGTCYNYPTITVGDVDLVLGYLNPEYFLGGQVKLDKDAALRELEKHLAKPLGMNVYDACDKVLDLLHSRMADKARDTIVSKGYFPPDYTLLVYGGSGPMHMWGVVDRVNIGAAATVPFAGAFSAFGVACADYFHRYGHSVNVSLAAGMSDQQKLAQARTMNDRWKALAEQAYKELGDEGYPRDKIRLEYAVGARYIGQLDSWETAVPVGKIDSIADLNKVIDSFETVYTAIYPVGARFPEAGYGITEVIINAFVDKVKPKIVRHELSPEKPTIDAHKGVREVYHKGQWMKFEIWEMNLLKAGNRIDGPAILEHPMTTLVLPPTHYVAIDEHLVYWYRKK
ncbi:Hydantoinase/oxoprolinase family protein [Georgfuchsia toluolica]|uniref:Hydantoinase/oxoprolinase family protein n=2 Tax=Georgfuchsia toluolica TaxID=424218 RepID=A0A916J5N8_9PROT|nr:Hydantoinase/oxoprolinase family protein [Georgfuchsia toluolica]